MVFTLIEMPLNPRSMDTLKLLTMTLEALFLL